MLKNLLTEVKGSFRLEQRSICLFIIRSGLLPLVSTSIPHNGHVIILIFLSLFLSQFYDSSINHKLPERFY